MPCSAPLYAPRAISRSASRACAIASSAKSVMNELSAGSVRPIASRCAAASSVGDSRRAAISRAASAMVRKRRSSETDAIALLLPRRERSELDRRLVIVQSKLAHPLGVIRGGLDARRERPRRVVVERERKPKRRRPRPNRVRRNRTPPRTAAVRHDRYPPFCMFAGEKRPPPIAESMIA